MKDFAGDDLSFVEYLDREGVEEDERASAIGYVEGFNAADARVASARALGLQQAAEDASGGERVYKVRGGYDLLPKYLAGRIAARGGELRMGERVRRVEWRPGRVTVTTETRSVVGSRVVVTLPLGVLQSRAVAIDPEPVEVMRAAERMRMGPVCRFTLSFRTRFWEALEPQPAMRRLSFLMTPSELPPVWWTAHPEGSNSLTGWVGGPRSEALLGKSADGLGRAAVVVLARVTGLTEEEVRGQMTGCYTHDWSGDEFSRGSYSYVAVGGTEASAVMATAFEETVYFAGEHTDVSGHWGTVHGAMRSGLRAAAQIRSGREGLRGER